MPKDLKDVSKNLEQMVKNATAQTASMQRESAEKTTRMAQMEQRLKTQREAAQRAVSKPRKISIDLGGGTLAQVSTETVNWIVRRAGDWSGDGFWAHNVDLMQGLPHLVLGSLAYVAEMATRRTEKGGEVVFPSGTRLLISEFAKLFSQLGFANLARAVRTRMADGKVTAAEKTALQAENAVLQQKLREAQAAAKKT